MERATRMLARAKHVVVLTGAGISAESGIRTFRDTMRGLWKDFDPATLATPEAFARDPEVVTRWYDHRRLGCLAAEPNAGHTALVAIERGLIRRGGRFTLLTQNVDRLHHRAGSANVHELHGTIVVWRCTATGNELEPPPSPFREFPPRSAWGGLLRPAVVWFGEMLPIPALDAAARALRTCDCFMSVGTSSAVYPAAGFVDLAAASGSGTIEVNPQETPASGRFDVSIRARAGAALPELAARAFGTGT
ncbi:MAG: NAD-dependent deacylase [Phycisphaerae bacterium]|nr:NAD-dependent deacylase [Phycisphaerae bacterium]